MRPPLLLASTSPRRADLLRAAGVAFEQRDPGVDDAAEAALAAVARRAGRPAAVVVRRLALAKLLAVLPEPAAAADRDVLAADTVVACDAAVLGKPADRAAARASLLTLRGRTHEIVTGVALRRPSGRLRLAVATSRVRFAAFAEAQLEAFLESGLWRGKAGGYGIQDPEAGFLVAGVEGSASNVRGLPLEVVEELLRS